MARCLWLCRCASNDDVVFLQLGLLAPAAVIASSSRLLGRKMLDGDFSAPTSGLSVLVLAATNKRQPQQQM